MKKVLKWIGIVLGGLVGLLALALVVLYAIGSARLNKTHDIQVETVAIPTDEVAVARGRHLAEAVAFCQACHGTTWEEMSSTTIRSWRLSPLPT